MAETPGAATSRRLPRAAGPHPSARTAAALRDHWLTGRSGQSPPPDPEDAGRLLTVAALLVGVGLLLLVVALQSLFPRLLEVRLGAVLGADPTADVASTPLSALGVSALAGLTGGAGLCLLCLLGRRLAWSEAGRVLGHAGAAAAAAGAALDLLSLVLLTAAETGRAPGARTLSSGLAVATVACVVLAVPVAVAGAAAAVRRLPRQGRDPLQGRRAVSVVLPPQLHVDAGHGAPPATPGSDDPGPARWKRGYFVPQLDLPAEQRSSGTDVVATVSARSAPPSGPTSGFCVSGGGIRSASVALGALQVLRQELLRADHLVSVSGGGYTAGALQLALKGVPDPAAPRDALDLGRPTLRQREPTQDPAAVLMPGTVEEDHLRRHSSYLADGPVQWLVALGVVLRCLLVSIGLVVLMDVVLGAVAGLAYRIFPLADLSSLQESTPGLPGIRAAVVHAAVSLAVLGCVIAAAAVVVSSRDEGPPRGRSARWATALRAAAVAAAALSILVAVTGAGLPLLMWAAVRVGDGPVAQVAAVGGGAGGAAGAAGALLLTYAATLVGVLWRQRESLLKKVRALRGGRTPALAQGLAQRLVVLLALAVLLCGFALLLGRVALELAVPTADSGQGPAPIWESGYARIAVGAALLLGVCWAYVDQTWLGLHPFYRRRLASAFAVRPRRGAGGPSVAVPYRQAERTALSAYGAREQGFPQVVFSAAANLSGQERTPPGRRAVGFTFTDEWIGGPDVGYVRTSDVERLSPQIGRDLTVQAAVAVSGAAISSAMGRQSRAFQTFFALTNVRLGTWLPNPVFLHRWSRPQGDWTLPSLPRIRRLSYLLREVAGSYPCDDRFLMITDGGHYENLGLVELLRRRPTTVFCIDASGDSPPVAGTLAEAISLAYDELGVVVELEHVWRLVPGSSKLPAESDLLAALNGRLSDSAVLRGTITYPEASGLPVERRTGTIYVAKAVLTPTMPYPVLAHAARHSVFPSDSTSDQWFDHSQFTAYTALGRSLGQQVTAAVDTEQEAGTRQRNGRSAPPTSTVLRVPSQPGTPGRDAATPRSSRRDNGRRGRR